jgi:alpha-1,3-glucosyltransferase
MFSAAIDATERRVRGGGVALVLASTLLLRCFVATFPHSGQATPPKYGDYEAQRHWMVRLARDSCSMCAT